MTTSKLRKLPAVRPVAVKVRPHLIASLDGLIAIAAYDLIRSGVLAAIVLAAVQCHP